MKNININKKEIINKKDNVNKKDTVHKKDTVNKKYVGGKEASKILGVHQRTLYLWDKKGLIETIRTDGNKRLYNVEKYIQNKKCNENIENDKEECEKILEDINKIEGKLKLTYARVSSHGQANDLERQKEILKKQYPEHIMITDIGSGINFNKYGIRKIIKLAIAGKIEELVIMHKDRLIRFGYELIEDLIKEYSGGKIIIVEKKEDITAEEEMAIDVLQIMNVFTAKMNGKK